MDTAEHITRVRQLASWMQGQRWDDSDALLTMASVLGLMSKQCEQPEALMALFHRYATGTATIAAQVSADSVVSTHSASDYSLGDSPENQPPPGPRPDNGPPVAIASTLSSPRDKNFRDESEHDTDMRPSLTPLPGAQKKFSDE